MAVAWQAGWRVARYLQQRGRALPLYTMSQRRAASAATTPWLLAPRHSYQACRLFGTHFPLDARAYHRACATLAIVIVIVARLNVGVDVPHMHIAATTGDSCI